MMKTFPARNLALSLLFTAAAALTAKANTIQVSLVNAGNPSNDIASSVTIKGVTQKNVYIGPYTLSVNGVSMQAMCIDFDIASNIGDKWTAYETAVGSTDLSHTYSPSESQEYKEEAYLFSQITKTGADRLGIQEAAWDIMAYGITSSAYTNSLAKNSYIDAALANYSTFNNANYFIISDTVKGGEQEFIVDPPTTVTPEPSSFALMLTPALAMGAEAMRRRQRGFAAIS